MQAESSKTIAGRTKGKVMDPSDEGVSIYEAERIKLDMKIKVLESNLVSIWSKIVDTNFGRWDYEEFKARMAEQNPS